MRLLFFLSCFLSCLAGEMQDDCDETLYVSTSCGSAMPLFMRLSDDQHFTIEWRDIIYQGCWEKVGDKVFSLALEPMDIWVYLTGFTLREHYYTLTFLPRERLSLSNTSGDIIAVFRPARMDSSSKRLPSGLYSESLKKDPSFLILNKDSSMLFSWGEVKNGRWRQISPEYLLLEEASSMDDESDSSQSVNNKVLLEIKNRHLVYYTYGVQTRRKKTSFYYRGKTKRHASLPYVGKTIPAQIRNINTIIS